MKPVEERFWKRVCKNGPDGCWLWTAGLKPTGYGSFSPAMHVTYIAHRFAYELVKGPIPDGLTLDHLCRNRACVNPEHLEAVTLRVNTLRGNSISAINARKTHCKRGYLFDEANTYINRNGTRCCRACAAAYQRERRRRLA